MEKGITSQEMDATTASGLVPHLGTTTNSGNSYSVTSNTPISTNQKFTIKFNVASSTAPTLKINDDAALPIKNANGNNSKLFASVYTLFWDGSAFILQGEGGEYGTATAADVLAPKTIGTQNGLVTGTIVNRGAGGLITPGTSNITKQAGNYTSDIVIRGEPNKIPGNIKQGVSIDGVTGTLEQAVKGTALLNAFLSRYDVLPKQTRRFPIVTVPAGATIISFEVNDNSIMDTFLELYQPVPTYPSEIFLCLKDSSGKQIPLFRMNSYEKRQEWYQRGLINLVTMRYSYTYSVWPNQSTHLTYSLPVIANFNKSQVMNLEVVATNLNELYTAQFSHRISGTLSYL
ncbi:hypothetical protein [Paenibacillus lautus]|uniref:hypothetical protein n=1 Tax=Paenibacillus lautus TaxID=1401 RepID=UPI003985C2F7